LAAITGGSFAIMPSNPEQLGKFGIVLTAMNIVEI
ncbi:hypothetical protein AAUPMC_13041, partial [Pasteurella multocida subsp. multocida str. Anand1_cattle]